MSRVTTSPGFLKQLVDKFEESRTALRIIHALHLSNHPEFRDLIQDLKGLSNANWQKKEREIRSALIDVLYLTAGRLQYKAKPEVAREHKRLRESEDKVAADLQPCSKPTTGYRGVKQALLRQHMKEVPGGWFSLPDMFFLESEVFRGAYIGVVRCGDTRPQHLVE